MQLVCIVNPGVVMMILRSPIAVMLLLNTSVVVCGM
jgi:hypothetical protein